MTITVRRAEAALASAVSTWRSAVVLIWSWSLLSRSFSFGAAGRIRSV